jgi:D-alanyl-D-alanine dipeptidase
MKLKTLAAGISLACCLAPHTLYAADGAQRIQAQRPADVVDVGAAIPQMQFDMRYASAHNFVGRRIHGYEAAACLLTTSAVNALKNVEQQLLPMGLTLKAYDCYRPQRAVDDFVQ